MYIPSRPRFEAVTAPDNPQRLVMIDTVVLAALGESKFLNILGIGEGARQYGEPPRIGSGAIVISTMFVNLKMLASLLTKGSAESRCIISIYGTNTVRNVFIPFLRDYQIVPLETYFRQFLFSKTIGFANFRVQDYIMYVDYTIKGFNRKIDFTVEVNLPKEVVQREGDPAMICHSYELLKVSAIGAILKHKTMQGKRDLIGQYSVKHESIVSSDHLAMYGVDAMHYDLTVEGRPNVCKLECFLSVPKDPF